ncbi:MAG: hypothetical protein ABII89_07075 [Candidatus Omnitrophota bacterium]
MGKQKRTGGGIGRTFCGFIPHGRLMPSAGLVHRSFSAGGFTLIEVLLSLFLAALISGILFASFFLPLRAVSAAKVELVKVEEVAVFLTRFSEEISAAYPEAASFFGTRDSIFFLSSAGTNLGLEKIGYTVKNSDFAETVTIYRKAGFPYRTDGNEQPVLQAENMVFNYYDGTEWSEEWNEKGLPLLVEVNLYRKGKSFRVFCGPRTDTDSDADTDSDTGVGRG